MSENNELNALTGVNKSRGFEIIKLKSSHLEFSYYSEMKCLMRMRTKNFSESEVHS